MKTRRGNGEGSVIKLSNRNYKAVVVVGWKDSAHPIKRTKSGFKTVAEARAYIPILKGEKQQKHTFEDYWVTVQKQIASLDPRTQDKYRLAHERIKPIAHLDIRQVSISQLNDLISPYTYNSAHSIQNLLSKIYDLAQAEQVIGANLAHHLTLPSAHDEKPKMPFAKGEIDILWSAWHQEKERILGCVLLSCYTGIMPIELCRLTTSNCDFSTCTINGVGAKTDKRKQSPILVPDIVIPVLHYLCDQAEDGRILPRSDKRYREDFKRLMARLNLSTDHTPYDCRHTAATMYARVLDPNTLKEVMRHTNLQMTEHYKHNRSEDMLNQLNQGIKKEQG